MILGLPCLAHLLTRSRRYFVERACVWFSLVEKIRRVSTSNEVVFLSATASELILNNLHDIYFIDTQLQTFH